ncbi:hypothetical protein BJV74DRAFT_883095 [Russula compacta]|nr:hypothetical protein BJV74DRAFT_883095 [Russula compacta]
MKNGQGQVEFLGNNGPAKERREVHASILDQQTSGRLLRVALDRALERRLGQVPSPLDVDKALDALGGAKSSAFVQHAVRVQEQLARLNEQLQRDQERHGHATDAVQDASASSSKPRKRSVEHVDKSSDPPREIKRSRVGSTSRLPHTLPSTSDHEAKKESRAPDASMSPKDVPIAPLRSTRSVPRATGLPRVDPALPQATVDDSSSRLPIMDTGKPTPSDNTKSDSIPKTGQQPSIGAVDGGDQRHTESQAARSGVPAPADPSLAQTRIQDKLRKPSSLPPSTFIPDEQGSPLPASDFRSEHPVAPGLATEIGLDGAASPANVPGIWAIQVGKPSASQIDITFAVDQDTASSAHRWATHRRGFNPDAQHVVVHLVALQAAAVSAVQQSLSQSPGGITPRAFTLALRDLQPQWPDDGSLVLQLNVGQSGEQTWFPSDMSGGTPLDVSGAVCAGTNSLRILQLKNMADLVFAMYAIPPPPGIIAAALEWETRRRLYSFQRPASGRLPE